MGAINNEQNKKLKRGVEEVVVQQIINRLLAAEAGQSALRQRWISAKREYDAELVIPDEDRVRQLEADSKGVPGKPVYLPVRIPYTYATVQTYLTYLLALFTKRRPWFDLEGETPYDSAAADAMETVLHNNAIRRGFFVPVHSWFKDALIYNRGILWRSWYRTIRHKRIIAPRYMLGMDFDIGGTAQEVQEVVDEGNDLFTSSPLNTYFDPGVTMQKFQEGEFVARVYQQSYSYVLKLMRDGVYHDRRKDLPEFPNMRWKYRPNITNSGWSGLHPPVEIIDIVIDLIPREWGLGNSSWPEKWNIIVGNGAVVLRAQPLKDELEFPCYVLEPEFDSQSTDAKGLVEVMKPLQEVLSWLFNSHMDSVRKVIDNKIFYNPIYVDEDAILRGDPAIPLRENAANTPIGDVVYQLRAADVTGGNIRDAQFVISLIERVTAASTNFMGLVNTGGRKTATEVRQANALAGSRIEKTALIFSHMGWIPLARGLADSTQRLMSKERLVERLVGNASVETIKQIIKPSDVKGAFNYPPIDPTIPVDRYALAQTWTEILSILTKMPNQGGYDVGKIIAEIAKLSGIKDVARFKVNFQQGGEAAAEAQAGDTGTTETIPLNTGETGQSGLGLATGMGGFQGGGM